MIAMGATLMEALMFEDKVDRWEARERMKRDGEKVKDRYVNRKGEVIGAGGG